MTRNDDFDPTLAAWLHDQAPSQAPDRVLDAALERVAAESQRRGLLHRLVGGSPMTTFLRATALAAVVAGAVLVGRQLGNLGPNIGQVSPSPSASASGSAVPTASPSASVPVGCVNPPQDITDLIEAQQSEGSFLADCYGNDSLTVDGRFVGPGVADCPSAPEPAWLACSPYSLRAPGETAKVGVPELGVAVDPHVSRVPYRDFELRVIGHFDDRRAETCHNTSTDPELSSEPDAVVVARCQRVFVITHVEYLPAS